jgi:hypothetical protein
MREASVEEVLAIAKQEEEAKRAFQQKKEKTLYTQRGFSSEGQDYDAYS